MNQYTHTALLLHILTVCKQHTSTPYVVGGTIREVLRGFYTQQISSQEQHDIDITIVPSCMETIPIVLHAIGQYCAQYCTGKYTYTPHYQTIRIQYCIITGKERYIDITCSRKEKYLQPGATPTISFGTTHAISIEEDMLRRDFTCNACAISLEAYILFLQKCVAIETISNNTITYGSIDGVVRHIPLIAHATSISDISSGTIEILHNNTFMDDPTRIIRLFTYMAKCSFSMTPKTYTAYILACNANVLSHCSVERRTNAIEHAFRAIPPSTLLTLYLQYKGTATIFGIETIQKHIIEAIRNLEKNRLFTLCSQKERLLLLYTLIFCEYIPTSLSENTGYQKAISRLYSNILLQRPHYEDTIQSCIKAHTTYIQLNNNKATRRLYMDFCYRHSIICICYILLHSSNTSKIILEEYLYIRYNQKSTILFTKKELPCSIVGIEQEFYTSLMVEVLCSHGMLKEQQLEYATILIASLQHAKNNCTPY